MEFVELLRIRTLLYWHVGILLLVAIGGAVLGSHAEVEMVNAGGSTHLRPDMAIPLAGLAPLAMFFAAIFGSSAGTSLNRENATRELSWTKPVPRTIVALRYVAIDLGAVVGVFALTVLVIVAVLSILHVSLVPDRTTGLDWVLALGTAVMWYALVQLLTFALGAGGRSVGGIMWPVALLCAGLAHIGGPTGTIARVIDVINPLAYMSGVSFSSTGAKVNSSFSGPIELKVIAVWAFAAAFCAIAIALWPRKEA